MVERLFAIGLAYAAMAAAQDAVQVSGDYKTEIENNWVRVLRVKRGLLAKAPMHQHPASVAVHLIDSDQKITGSDGKAQEVKRKAGDVSFAEAVKHSEENLSDQPLEAVVIELKPQACRFQASGHHAGPGQTGS
jgi:uncharacterized RmlC-like cupin family protein